LQFSADTVLAEREDRWWHPLVSTSTRNLG